MEVEQFLRVVTLRRGGLRHSEFRLREGEKGLSLFAHLDHPSSTEVVEAVRAAGKRGDLGAAVIPMREILALGLTVAQTRGGTPVAGINAIHYEARVPFWRRMLLCLTGTRLHDYFNEHLSERLCAVARVLD
jgi:hypothetical protein